MSLGFEKWRRYRISYTAALLTSIVVSLLTFTGVIEHLERRTQDFRFRLRGPRVSQTKIVLAKITDDTTDAWEEPMTLWGHHYADILRQANHLKAAQVGFDIILDFNADRYLSQIRATGQTAPNADFAATLQKMKGKVALAIDRDNNITPHPDLLLDSDPWYNLGFVNLRDEPDDNVHSMSLFDSASDHLDRIHPSFIAVLAAQQRGLDPYNPELLQKLARNTFEKERATSFWLNSTVATISSIDAHRLAAGTLNDEGKAKVRGAIVIVGTAFSDDPDVHTYVGDKTISGVEVLAQGLATLLDGCALKRASRSEEALLVLALAVGIAVISLPLSLGRGLMFILVACLIWCVLAQYAFVTGQRLLPIAGPVGAFFLPWIVFQIVRSVEENVLRLRIESIFGRNVSPQIKDYLLASATHRDLGRGAQGEASILFLDIQGFTRFVQQHELSSVMDELNAFFSALTPIIDRHGGYLNRYTGDGFLAIFGAPHAQKDHAQAAVDAALAIVETVRQMNIPRTSKNLQPWSIRCGIHSGPLVYGNIGSPERSEFTVYGDTVNLASRLEGLNKEFGSKIVLSEATYCRLTCRPPVEGPIAREIRDRSGEVMVYWIRI